MNYSHLVPSHNRIIKYQNNAFFLYHSNLDKCLPSIIYCLCADSECYQINVQPMFLESYFLKKMYKEINTTEFFIIKYDTYLLSFIFIIIITNHSPHLYYYKY